MIFSGNNKISKVYSGQTAVKSIWSGNTLVWSSEAAPLTPDAYVQDGLYAMWDGEWNGGRNVHEDNITVWKNIGLSGEAFDANSSASHTCGSNYCDFGNYENDGLIFDVGNNFMSEYMKGEYTVEVVFKCYPNYFNRQKISGIFGNHGIARGIVGLQCVNGEDLVTIGTYSDGMDLLYTNTSILSGDGNRINSYTAGATASGLSCTGYCGGSVLSSTIATYDKLTLTNNNPFKIGSAYVTDRKFFGCIYCLRVYNRKLTDAEVAANAVVDKKRFGIYTANSNVSDFIVSIADTVAGVVPTITNITNNIGKPVVEGTDYTVSFSGYEQAGTGTATISGIGSYVGTKQVSFTVLARTLNSITKPADTMDTGSALQPLPTVKNSLGETLTRDVDYQLSYANNALPGTATVTATGIGLYSGSVSQTWTIYARDISLASVNDIGNAYAYTGSAVEPLPNVKNQLNQILTKDVDYTVSYLNNVDIGTASLIVTGIGSYVGTQTVTFLIASEERVLTYVTRNDGTGTTSYNINGLLYAELIGKSQYYSSDTTMTDLKVGLGVNNIELYATYKDDALSSIDLSEFTDPNRIPYCGIRHSFLWSSAITQILVANQEMLNVFSTSGNWAAKQSLMRIKD